MMIINALFIGGPLDGQWRCLRNTQPIECCIAPTNYFQEGDNKIPDSFLEIKTLKYVGRFCAGSWVFCPECFHNEQLFGALVGNYKRGVRERKDQK